mgnify:CR=1 FL=1|jgi:hypothetical protein
MWDMGVWDAGNTQEWHVECAGMICEEQKEMTKHSIATIRLLLRSKFFNKLDSLFRLSISF